MTGIFDGITEVKHKTRAICGVTLLKEKLDPDDRAAFLHVVEETDVPASAIRDRLMAAGHDISKDVLWRHRKRDCKCPREATK